MKRPALLPALFAATLLIACSDRISGGASATTTEATGAAAPLSPTAPPRLVPSASPAAGGAQAPGPAEFDGKRALELIRHLANDIGPRVSGTKGEKDATDFIASQLRSSGYDVELMSFTVDENRFGSVLIDGQQPGLQSLVLSGSGKGSATGRAAFVGVAATADLAGKDLKGMVAVADRGGAVTFGAKYDNVRAAGAIGLIVINNANGLFTGNLSKTAEIPVVGVAGEDGAALKAAAQAGKPVAVEVPDAPKGINVIARSRAGDRCNIVVGGHHDTVPAVPGATDNASGAASVVELARAFAADGLDPGLCFVTFGGEESGLFGSAAFAGRLRDTGALPAYMVNLDVTGTGDALELIGDRQLQTKALAIAKTVGVGAEASNDPANTGSDHMSFRQVGVPVIFLAGNDYSMIHTPRDTYQVLNHDLVEKAGDVAYALIADLAKQVAPRSGGS
jgi:aminopeptidase YwaD